MWIHLIRIEGGIIDQLNSGHSGHVRGTSNFSFFIEFEISF